MAKYCLNPYYTGIHLHIRIKEEVSDVIESLNPYYTGIHLHGEDSITSSGKLSS